LFYNRANVFPIQTLAPALNPPSTKGGS
jgi:hypothetical protein